MAGPLSSTIVKLTRLAGFTERPNTEISSPHEQVKTPQHPKGLQTWKARAHSVKRDVLVLYRAYHDSRVPWYAKLLIVATIAYTLSPIDLIPDFIPVFGYLDDLILIPFAVVLAVKLIPPAVLEEYRQRSSIEQDQRLPTSWAGAALVLLAWFVIGVWSSIALYQWMK